MNALHVDNSLGLFRCFCANMLTCYEVRVRRAWAKVRERKAYLDLMIALNKYLHLNEFLTYFTQGA
jgi:hypothetical protein